MMGCRLSCDRGQWGVKFALMGSRSRPTSGRPNFGKFGYPSIAADEALLEGLPLVAAVHESRRTRGFNGGKRLKDSVGVGRSLGHHPRVARLQQQRLALDFQLGLAADDVADRLVIARSARLRVASLLVFPQTHPHVNARGKIPLAHGAARRMP